MRQKLTISSAITCILRVKNRRTDSTAINMMNAPYVALRRLGVTPGVKTDSHRSETKDAMRKEGAER